MLSYLTLSYLMLSYLMFSYLVFSYWCLATTTGVIATTTVTGVSLLLLVFSD